MQILIFIVLVGNTGLGVVIILTPLLYMRLLHVAQDIIQIKGGEIKGGNKYRKYI